MRADWTGRGDLRAADADREATAERLRHAHGEGRLDTGELEERLQACYSARTYGELDWLVADLPGTPKDAEASRRQRRPARLVPLVAVLVALAIVFHAGWVLWGLVVLAVVRGRRRGYGWGCRARYVSRV